VLTTPERARRYHEAAVKDANRQISILKALVDTNEDEDTRPMIENISIDDDQNLLSSAERGILEDSVFSVTSSVIFEKVRRDAVEKYSSQLPTNYGIAEE